MVININYSVDGFDESAKLPLEIVKKLIKIYSKYQDLIERKDFKELEELTFNL